ncbi:MAG: OmpA family protein [Thermoanaerobaculales bacterium]|jgi:peptidoglycan-associated lipoprotein|nr:OmpA family protein [Thermoanaerobaculales bacterium]
MKQLTRMVVTAAMLLMVVGLGACSSSGAKKMQAPAPVKTATPTPAIPSGVSEEVIHEPVTETMLSEAVTSELPEDLARLNAQGYLEDVFFDTSRHELTPEARELLAKNAAWLQQYPTILILVEGHCDERNTREYNLALGERRAGAVRDFLGFLGIAPERVKIISYGEERPFALGSDESAWRLNRRAHFVIVGR